MNGRFRQFMWILSACFLASCSSSGDRAAKAPPETPPAQVAAPAAPARPANAPATALVPGGQPVVELSETSFNFGSLHEDKDYVHEFKIRNVGTGVLEIKKVLPG